MLACLAARYAIAEPPMRPAALVTLNMRELDRLKVIQAVADGMLKPWRAALPRLLPVR